ncbi:MAG: hypothetical protein OQL09_06655 [Gammaproteobacteria bacterium]|nr:hypothetical protein [Gammaproteobacteria bacterium]
MNKILSLLFVGLASMQATNINAETLVRPRASVGFASYELSFSDPTLGSISDTSYMTLGAGATFAQDNIYFDVSVTTALGASHDFTEFDQDEDFFRNDLALTVGLVLDQGISVFGGYKSGETEYENPSATSTLLSFETSGIFGGASMSFPSGNDVVSVNAALAFMEGTLTDNDTAFTPYDETADTIGLSFGAAYVKNITNDTGLMFKGAFQLYAFSDWTGNYSIADLDETIFSVEAAYFVNF